jgi:tetratricopeptide (TPR) repeat protein
MAMDERETGGAPPFQVTVEDLFVRGDHEAILALAEERLAQWPDDPLARLAQCRVWIQQGRLEEAQSLLKDLEPLLVDLGRIYAALGDRFLKKGREEEARAYYRKTMFLSPDTPLPADSLPSPGEEAPKAAAPDEPPGESAEGEEPEGEAGPEVPADFQTVTLAELYIRQGHLAQAEEVLEAILRKDPWQARAAEKLREVRAQLGGDREPGGQAAVIAELSRWLAKLERRPR